MSWCHIAASLLHIQTTCLYSVWHQPMAEAAEIRVLEQVLRFRLLISHFVLPSGQPLWHCHCLSKKTADFIKLSPRSENPSSCHLKRVWAHRSRRLCRMPTAQTKPKLWTSKGQETSIDAVSPGRKQDLQGDPQTSDLSWHVCASVPSKSHPFCAGNALSRRSHIVHSAHTTRGGGVCHLQHHRIFHQCSSGHWMSDCGEATGLGTNWDRRFTAKCLGIGIWWQTTLGSTAIPIISPLVNDHTAHVAMIIPWSCQVAVTRLPQINVIWVCFLVETTLHAWKARDVKQGTHPLSESLSHGCK